MILDAPFDHITPLALMKMPSFASSLTIDTIHHYWDLDVTESLLHYYGKVRI